MLKLCLWNSLFKTWDDFCRQFQKRKKKKSTLQWLLTTHKYPLPYCLFQWLYFRAYQGCNCAQCVWVYFRKHVLMASQDLRRPATPPYHYGLPPGSSSTVDGVTTMTGLSESAFYPFELIKTGLPPPPPFILESSQFEYSEVILWFLWPKTTEVRPWSKDKVPIHYLSNYFLCGQCVYAFRSLQNAFFLSVTVSVIHFCR